MSWSYGMPGQKMTGERSLGRTFPVFLTDLYLEPRIMVGI